MIKKINVKETKRYWGDIEGSLVGIISSLQLEIDEGWEGIENEYERSYGEPFDHEVPYLYKYREENDSEYNKRVKNLEKEKTRNLKDKEQKLKKLKKELSSNTGFSSILSNEEKKQLGLK